MFGLQITLLYAGVAMLLCVNDLIFTQKYRLLGVIVLLILPIYPQILIYSRFVLKDVQYAFSFFFVSATLAYYTLNNKQLNFAIVIPLVLVMIYGAAVKYQGQFCVIVLAIWLGILLTRRQKSFVQIFSGLLIYIGILGSIQFLNHALVPKQSKSYAWQFVKLYDLAAISIAQQQDLIPNSNKTASYSTQKLQERFKYPGVDPYIYSNDNILRVTKNPEKMSELYRVWVYNVMSHPLVYLKHRAINIAYAVLSRPGFEYAEKVLNKLPQPSLSYNIAYATSSFIFYIFMSHLPVIVLGLGYFGLALYSWRICIAAPVLLGFTSVALLMVAILFFMSMAGVTRYTYISVLMIHAAHIFAFKCILDIRHHRLKNNL